MKVFLAVPFSNSNWRGLLSSFPAEIEFYNPISLEQNEYTECTDIIVEEIYQRNLADFHLYVITPKTITTYLIAELVDASNKHPEKTLFVHLDKDEDCEFTKEQSSSMLALNVLLTSNGVKTFDSLKVVSHYLIELTKKKIYNQYFIEAMDILTTSLKENPENAWNWHSALSMTFYELGVDKKTANIGASRILLVLFGIDVTNHPVYLQNMLD